jgi:penicillin-binding protein 2
MNKTGPAFSDFVAGARSSSRRSRFSMGGVSIAEVMPLLLLFIIFTMICMRLFYLQVVQADYYKNLSDNNRTRSVVVPAQRGIVFDRNDKPLVRNIAAYKKVGSDKKVEWIPAEKALELLASNTAKGLEIDTQREYPYGEAFAHTVGYIGQISEEDLAHSDYQDYRAAQFIGKMGLEEEYEMILAGSDGRELFEVNANGEHIRKLGRKEPIAGQDIKTTLVVEVQQAAMDALSEASKAAVVVSDPRDGGIIALYSKPSFDPNLFTHNKDYKAHGAYTSIDTILTDSQNQPFLNRAIGGVYPPGSTFKLVSAVAALESGKVKKDTKIEDTGVIRVGEFSYSNWYFTQHGKTDDDVDVVKALQRSNDIYFYRVAQEAGVKRLASFSRLFGLGAILGIDIQGEAKGIVPDEEWKKKEIGESWYLGDTFHYGIGQGFLLTTPLQVNMMTSVFANDGTLYKPHILSTNKQVLRRDFVDKSYREAVREGMKKACEPSGTAWPFFDFKVKNDRLKIDNLDYIKSASSGAEFTRIMVGCKTGTAETYADQDSHAWLTVFAPYYNPEVVVTVLLEHGGEGSSDAGPIAKKILEKYFEVKK